jgi:hypothetical protein
LLLALLLVYRPSSRLSLDPVHHTDEDDVDLDLEADDDPDAADSNVAGTTPTPGGHAISTDPANTTEKLS